MEKVYEELEEVKTANETLLADNKTKLDLLNNLKKLQTQQSVELNESRSLLETQTYELDAKTRLISELNRTNEDLQHSLKEKESVVKQLNSANEKLKANREANNRVYEDERQKLVLALNEANERNIDIEEKSNVYKAEIEGLKRHLVIVEKKKTDAERVAKSLKETKRREDVMSVIEDEKSRVEEELKWKKEQFTHLEEAYEKLQNTFHASEKAYKEEKSCLLDELCSLQTKLDSRTRISGRDEEVAELRGCLGKRDAEFKEVEYEKGKLERENQELLVSLKELQEATIQGSGNSAVTKLKSKFRKLENVHKNCLVTLRSKEAEWSSRIAEEVSGYKLQTESKEVVVKELEVELENCRAFADKLILQYEEISVMFLVLSRTVFEARTQVENVKDEETKDRSCSLLIEQLEQKNVVLVKVHEELVAEREKVACLVKRVETLDHFEERSLEMVKEVERYKETLVEFSRLQTVKDEETEERRCSMLIEQLEQKNVVLVKAHEEIEAEREKVACLVKRVETLDHFEERNLEMEREVERYKETLEEFSRLQTEMKEKMKEAEKDYEEKLLQVCDALDNTNSDLVQEREKVSVLTRRIESFGIVKEKSLVMEKELQKYKEMLEESEKSRVLLEEQMSKLESDSKENIRELCRKVDIAYAKLAEEVQKNASLIQNEEHRQNEFDHYKEMLEESTKTQLLLQEKVVEMENDSKRKLDDISEALEAANCELSDKTSEAYQVEFQLWVWKSIAKRLKVELEQSQNLRKRVEASVLEQVGVEEALRQERNELKHKLKKAAMSDSEKEILVGMIRDKDNVLTQVQTEVELLEQELLQREHEDALFAHITAEKVKEEISSLSKKLEASEEQTSQMQEKLRDSEEEKKELVKEVSSLSSEKQNLLCFIGEMEKRMSELCEEDAKLLKTLEKTTQCCDGFGKENNNVDDSPRLSMKYEDVAVEDRSPFRQLNH